MASFIGAFHILTGIEKMSQGLLNHDNKDRILQSDSLSFCHGFERFAGFKEGERERIANHFTNRFQLDMLDRELSVKVGPTSHRHISTRLQYTCRAGIGELPTSAEGLSNSR